MSLYLISVVALAVLKFTKTVPRTKVSLCWNVVQSLTLGHHCVCHLIKVHCDKVVNTRVKAVVATWTLFNSVHKHTQGGRNATLGILAPDKRRRNTIKILQFVMIYLDFINPQGKALNCFTLTRDKY